jgi:hypothetical protein
VAAIHSTLKGKYVFNVALGRVQSLEALIGCGKLVIR